MTALTFHQGLVTPSDKNCSWWWKSFHSVLNLTKATISPFLWIYTNKIKKKKEFAVLVWCQVTQVQGYAFKGQGIPPPP